MDTFKFFVYLIIIQLFYGFAITLLAYAFTGFPSISSDVTGSYTTGAPTLANISQQIEATTQNQMKLPSIVDMGALLFYSGNIIIDLMVNMFTALPSMFTILVSALLIPFAFDPVVATNLKIFFFAIVSVIYFINLLAFLINIRAGGGKII